MFQTHVFPVSIAFFCGYKDVLFAHAGVLAFLVFVVYTVCVIESENRFPTVACGLLQR